MLRCGLAQVKITPPFPVVLAGGCFGESTGVLTDLYAGVLVLEHDGVRTAIISLDLCGLGVAEIVAIRKQLQSDYAIDHAMITTSHTHSGPCTFSVRGGWGEVDPRYMQLLRGNIAAAVAEAVDNTFPAQLATTSTMVDDLTYCPDHRNPIGRIDPELGLIVIYDTDDRIRGVLVNFSCHSVCLHGYRNLISADFPGYLRLSVTDEVGPNIVSLYLPGPQGDIMPQGFKGAGRGGPELAQQMGADLAGHTLAAIRNIPTPTAPLVNVRSKHVQLPYDPLPSPGELRRELARLEDELAKGELGPEAADVCRADIEWAHEALEVLRTGRIQQSLQVELQAVVLGSTTLLTMPFELYAEIGLRIKEHSPFTHTFVVALANGLHGYLATPAAYDARTYTTNHACHRMGIWSFTRNVADVLTTQANALLAEAKSDPPREETGAKK